MADILPGTSVSIADDIVIGGVIAFVRGEPVVVEQVSPNAADPSFRYVVFSQIMNTRYQLRDADLVREVEPATSAGRSRRGLIVTLVVIAVVIVAGAAVATVVVGRKKNPEISGGQKTALTTGIASSQTAQARRAGEILRKSASAIAAASSVKMDMAVQTQVNGTNVSGRMQIEQVEKGASGTESMMTGVFEGRESVIYVIGSTAYIYTNGS